MSVLLLIVLQEVFRPLAQRSGIPKRRSHPKLNNLTCLLTGFRDDVRVLVPGQLHAMPSVEDGEIARAQINFDHGQAVDGHLKALRLALLLVVAVCGLAVEPSSPVPVKVRIVAVLEDTHVASVYAATAEGLLCKILIQLPHI